MRKFSQRMPQQPKALGHYQILEQIGIGGMGIVYKARDPKIKRDVAIKLIKNSGASTVAHKRFYREITVCAKLQHPNIIKLFDIGEVQQTTYMVMEHIDGLPLLEYLECHELDWHQKLDIVAKVACALHYAHGKKVVHRDIKPSNIMVRNGGEPVLMDFGLAKTTEVKDRSLTLSGEVIGTPQYMAPEQARGRKRHIDTQTDIYALGAVLYHILSGRPPVEGESLMEILHHVVVKSPRSLTRQNAKIPKTIEKICFKALQKKKKHRYLSAQQFAEDIRSYLEGNQTHAQNFYRKRLWSRMAMAFAFLMLLVGGAFTSYRILLVPEKTVAKIQRYYESSKKLTNPEKIYLQLTQAAKLLEDLKKEQAPQYVEWKSKLDLAFVEHYYQRGCHIWDEQPQLASVYFSRALKLATLLPTYRQKWHDKLHRSLIHAYFKMQNYETLRQIIHQNPHLTENLDIKWMSACSAYFCEEPDALLLLQQVEKKLRQRDLKYVAILYYQGMLYYRSQNIKRASEVFAKAIQLIGEVKKNWKYRDRLYLYYSLTTLLQRGQSLTAKEKLTLLKYLRRITPAQVSPLLYKETWARYYLMQITASRLPTKQRTAIAFKLLALIKECLKYDSDNADYYFIRAMAYKHLTKYPQALDDFTMAAEIDPSNLQPLTEKLHLFADYVDIARTNNYVWELIRHFDRVSYVNVQLFASEFIQLYKTLKALGYNRLRTIPFSKPDFHKFYQVFMATSADMSRVAQATIAAMEPHQQVLRLLQDRSGNDHQQAMLSQLRQAVEKAAHVRRRHRLLQQLGDVPADGIIAQSVVQHFHPHYLFLQEVLQGRLPELQILDDNLQILIRFLAARLLAQRTDWNSRRELIDMYRENDRTTTILVARALSEKCLIFFDNTLLCQYVDEVQNEFLQTSLAQTLTVATENGRKALVYLLTNGTERAKISAAGQLIRDLPQDIWPQFSRVIHQSCSSKNPHVRALSISTVWSYAANNFYFRFHLRKIKEFYPNLLQALQDKSQLVQRAAFMPLRLLETPYRLNSRKAIPHVIKIFRSAPSPMMRHQSILALGQLRCEMAFSEIAFNPKRPLLERMAALIGLPASNNSKHVRKWQNTIMQSMHNDSNKAVQGFILLALSRYTTHFQRLGIPVDFIRILLENKIVASLQDPDPLLRFYATSSCAHLSRTSPQIMHALQNVWYDAKCPWHIKEIAMVSIMLLALKTDAKEYLQWLDKTLMQSSRQDLRLLAFLAYIRIVFDNIECKSTQIFTAFNWEYRSIFDYRMQILQRHATRPSLRNKYIFYLQRALAIADNVEMQTPLLRQLLKESIYALAVLYEADGNNADAIRLILRYGSQLRWRKTPRILSMLGRLMLQKGQAQQALSLLQKIGQDNPQQDAAMTRTLAAVHLALGHNRQAHRLFLKQYYLAPDYLQALIALANYYSWRGDYQQAKVAFREAHLRFYRSGEAYFHLARIAAIENNADLAIRYLQDAHYECYLNSYAQLKRCSELLPLLQHPKMKKFVQKCFKN